MALPSINALAHKASDSFLYVDDNTLRFDLALADVARLYAVDLDSDGQLTWGELRALEAPLASRIVADMSLSRLGEHCQLSPGLVGLSRHSDGDYAVWNLDSPCLELGTSGLTLHYGLLFQQDSLHRLLYSTETAEGRQLGVVAPDKPYLVIGATSWLQTAVEFFKQGVIHLVLGYDHLLFLAALLLPVCLFASRDASDHKTVFRNLFWVVSAFTISHSVSLIAAVYSWLAVPSRWVEIAIALSISIAAILGLRRGSGKQQVIMAAGFGLIHGLGFANVLAGLIAASSQKLIALLAFNLGIEIAQLAVVVMAAPILLYVARHRSGQIVGYVSSALLVAVGAFWAFERI